MKHVNDITAQPSGTGFSFKALIAFLFQLRLRDKLSAANRDDGGQTWGL